MKIKYFVIFSFLLLAAFFFFLPAIYADSTVGWWAFNGDADDDSGNNLDGTLHNGADVSNNYLELNGTNQYVSVDDDDLLTFGDSSDDDAFSISAWVYMEDATDFPIFSKGMVPVDEEYRFRTKADDKLLLTLNDASEGPTTVIGRIYSGTALTNYEKEWIFLTATYDGSETSGGIKLYLNGTQVDDGNYQNGSYTAMENSDDPAFIGMYGFATYAQGKFDQVKLYDYELNATAVENIYEAEVDDYRLYKIEGYLYDNSNNYVNSVDTDVDNTEISFIPISGLNTGDGVKIVFANEFDLSSLDTGDISVSQNHYTNDIIAGTPVINSNEISIPITTQSDSPWMKVTVAFANSHITTPATPNSYIVTATTYDLEGDGFGGGNGDTEEDRGSVAFDFYNGDVEITATVDPTLSFTLSSTTCNLNTFSTTNIRTCSYEVTVTTNATGGYSAYIREDDDLKNSAGDMITDTASSYITSGGSGTDEEYGIGVDTQDTADIFPDYSGVDSCANLDNQSSTDLPAEPITGNDQRFATYTDPADGGSNRGQTTICHGAAIIGTTPAGVYSHNVIITITGNF